jgi:hypothetical protein
MSATECFGNDLLSAETAYRLRYWFQGWDHRTTGLPSSVKYILENSYSLSLNVGSQTGPDGSILSQHKRLTLFHATNNNPIFTSGVPVGSLVFVSSFIKAPDYVDGHWSGGFLNSYSVQFSESSSCRELKAKLVLFNDDKFRLDRSEASGDQAFQTPRFVAGLIKVMDECIGLAF